jgi:hypothetical protein
MHIDFDAQLTSVDILPVCIHILVLMFKKIGNFLDTFYEEYLSFQETRYYGMARILVGLEVRKGLVKLMDNKMGVDFFHLNIYYEGISFICIIHYHYYVHLATYCNKMLVDFFHVNIYYEGISFICIIHYHYYVHLAT